MKRKQILIIVLIISFTEEVFSQISEATQVWRSDQGNGNYRNPIIHADYSDPDVVRVGSDYYMTASSFEDVPGLPILHSKDLINWNLIGHALNNLEPKDHFSKPRHGEGVWAPSIRYHNNEYWIYYPDPDFGIYLIKAKSPAGPWSAPVLVEGGKGLIDPCPLWDEDGKIYLVHAYAGSRAGIKSILVVKQLNKNGDRVIDAGKIVYDGHESDPIIEGPKFYKRNGWYYIFAPAGGVTKGWQTVLRSSNIYGPYERKVVLEQGSTNINGPHQGAWVTTISGESWFIHFQDKGAYGRIVHLQPMQWVNDWPKMGIDKDGNGIGEPVDVFKKPVVGIKQDISSPPESDEFNNQMPGKQWQWPANPHPSWSYMYPSKGVLRLYAIPNEITGIWNAPNVLQQKFPAAEFQAPTKIQFIPNRKREEIAGLAIVGLESFGLALKNLNDSLYLVYIKETKEGYNEKVIIKLDSSIIHLRVKVRQDAVCHFEYSLDGVNYKAGGDQFTASPGKWKGAKIGLFCFGKGHTNDSGFVDFDWFKISRL